MLGAAVRASQCVFFGVIVAQAAIEVPSAVQTPPKRVSTCILCFAGTGGAGRRCAGSPLRPLPYWGVLLAYTSTGAVRGVCTLQLAEADGGIQHDRGLTQNDKSLTQNTREPKALTGSRILRVGIIRVGIGDRQKRPYPKTLKPRPDGVMT